jgi:O-Antigen ligase
MLVLAAIGSLFAPWELIILEAKFRPFDAFVLLMFFHLALTRGLATRLPLGLVLCGLYLCVQAASALMLGSVNFLREAIQAGVIFVFGMYLYNLTPEQLRRLLRNVTGLLLIVMLYNISWHLANGYYTGWKRLDAPKMAFLFLPVLLTYLALKHRETPSLRTRIATVLLPCMLPIIILSGERKALLFCLIGYFIYAFKTRMFLRPAGLFGLLMISSVAAALLPSLMEIPYVARQVNSLTSPFSTAEIEIYSNGEYFSESISNAQRIFAARVATEMFLSSPFIGVGTNGYESIVTEEFAYLPVLTTGIHSEPLRTLVENGVLGFLIFVLPLLRTLHFAIAYDGTDLGEAEWCACLLFLAAVMLLLAFESSGTKLMVPYVMVGMLPDLVRRLTMSTSKKPGLAVPTTARGSALRAQSRLELGDVEAKPVIRS